MAFHPDDLLPWLPDTGAGCHVAYSGGLDSAVLLYAMASLRDAGSFQGSLHAIHVNHGLHPRAGEWAAHCRRECERLRVPLHAEAVTVSSQGQGIEQAARDARYRVFAGRLRPGECLLTAHHLDDQVETLLFRLLRGTGLRGLAGIRRQRAFAGGTLVRPLLDVTRDDLLAFAEGAKLAWIEDDSNSDDALDRNYLRHRVMPVLASRWPGFRKNWQRLAGLAVESQAVLEEVGLQDLARVRTAPYKLSISALEAFSPARRRNILRSWLLALEADFGVPAPDAYVIDRVFSELIPAAADAEPVVAWRKGGQSMEIRRYAGHIHAVAPLPASATAGRLDWDTASPLSLPSGLGTLELVETTGAGFIPPADGRLSIGFRQGGESVKPAGRKTRALKKLLQDARVPPWWRDKVPLVYSGDDLVAVADLFLCEPRQAAGTRAVNGNLFTIRWQREDLHCGY